MPERHAGYIDDVRAEGDRRVRVIAVGELRGREAGRTASGFSYRANRRSSFGAVLLVGMSLAVRRVGGLLVRDDGLGVEVADLEQVERDAPAGR